MAVQRRLAAILAADVAGYSRMMGADEEGTRAKFNNCLDEIVSPALKQHGGRLVKTMGDGFLVEFGSVVDAVQCATDIQNGVALRQSTEPGDRKILIRIGIHLGDVIIEGDDIHGDGVNVAARLEGLAEPGGICVSSLVQASIRNKLDVVLDDLGDQLLKNIADPVGVYRVVLDTASSRPAAETNSLFRRPAVAVLPFENLSGDPDQEYFADGLTEDLITALSVWKSFPVIARNSTFAFKGKSPDIRKVGQDLGARYVIEGSVRKAGSRIRVSCQLIDAQTGHHVWAERYDRDLEDIFDLQDELTARIAGTVAPELERTEGVRSARKPHDLSAWDYVQQGFCLLDEVTFEGNAKARSLFERAIEIDHSYSRGYSGLAYTHHRDIVLGTSEPRQAKLEMMLKAAQRAAQLDELDAVAQLALGLAYYFLNRHDEALTRFETAVALNPNHWVAQRAVGQTLTLLGRPNEGLPHLERSFQLNPKDPRNHFNYRFMAWTHFTARRYEEAANWARQAIQRRATIPESHLLLAASLGHLGQTDEAREELDACEQLQPGSVEPDNWVTRYKNASDNDHLLDGLRKAGWER